MKTRIEKIDGNKFDFYYPNVHPKTGEVTEGVFKNKTLKEIKQFAERRELEVAELIKQITGAKTRETRAKKQAAEAKELENWKLGKWFGKGDSLLNDAHRINDDGEPDDKILQKLGKVWRNPRDGGDRTYFDAELSEQILSEVGFDDYAMRQIFYDHEKKEWFSKELSSKRSKKLHKYLVH